MRPARFVACLAACSLPWGAALAGVEVEGVGGALRDNVLAHLALDDAPCEAPAWRVRRLRRQAEAEVREALEAYGHYNPVITIESPGAKDCWLTRISIEPGEPVRLRRVEATFSGEAATDPAFQRLGKANPLRAGKVLDHGAYEKYKRAIGDLARRQGYFAGRFRTSRIEVRSAENLADVTLDYDSGPRYRFGPVSFEQSVVRQDLVERFVDFAPGDPYDGTKIDDFYNALLATGYFASVDLRTRPGTLPDDSVPVTVGLTAARRQVYTAGIGYGTDTGPKLRAGYTNRRLNERGHQFDASASVSEVLTEAGVTYRFPRADPRVEWLSLDAGYQNENTETSESEIWKIGVKEFHRRPHDWIETRFLDASIERFSIADERNREFLLIPGVSWSHRFPSSTTITRPDTGHRVSLKLSGTAEWLASDSEFLQADLFGKLVVPLWPGARALLRGEAGATAKEEFRSLPASVRYFAGGDYSVRGYDYETLGPKDENGDVVGGSHKLIASAEIDQRVWRNWSLAAFVDTGNAFDDFSDLDLKTGVGGGLRWYSPLGPVRVDVAFPLESNAPDSWRLHVTLGPDL